MQVAGSMFPGPGLPRAGAAGYVLTKSSGTDFDVEWAAASGGGVSAGTAENQVYMTGPGPGYAGGWVTDPTFVSLQVNGVAGFGSDVTVSGITDLQNLIVEGTLLCYLGATFSDSVGVGVDFTVNGIATFNTDISVVGEAVITTIHVTGNGLYEGTNSFNDVEVTGSFLYHGVSIQPIATSGSASDLSAGTVPAARMPAHTGDVTSSAGSVALTIASGAVTPSKSSAAANKVVVSVGFDGQGSAIAVNTYVDWRAPYSATIKKVSMVSVDGTTTTTVIGVWKDTWANWPPTVADKITGTAYPTITAGTKSEDSTLTGWTTTVTAGDVIRFNVDSNSAALRIALFLEMEKT